MRGWEGMVISCSNGVKWDREELRKPMGRVKLSYDCSIYFGFKDLIKMGVYQQQ